MGYKTLTFTNKVEQRTYVQGAFEGKYYGTINNQTSANNFESYDIEIYDGEISNLKNEKEHSEIINETIYNAIVSETQLVQKSFENVLVNLDHVIKEYDSFKLAIKEPKLEAVQIYDVVKDGNQTFGTLTCLVSGYLLETHTETSTMQVETCNECGEYLEECKCQESVLVTSDKQLNETPIPEVKKTFFEKFSGLWTKEYINRRWFAFKPFSFGCIGSFGLLIGILLLISFGFPGILIGSIVLLLFFIGSLTRIFPTLSLRWRRLLYTFLGFLFIGLLFNLFKPVFENYRSGINPQTETASPQTEGNQRILNPQNSTISGTEEQITAESTEATSSSTILIDTITNLSEENFAVQNGIANTLEEQNNTLQQDSINTILRERSVSQVNHVNSIPQLGTNNSVDSLNSNFQNNPLSHKEASNNYSDPTTEILIKQSSNAYQIPTENQKNNIVQTEGSNNTSNSIPENSTEESNDFYETEEEYQDQPKRPTKVRKAAEIMTGIIFQEGEIFICKGDYSKKYHIDPNCSGLSNCSTRIYQINIPVAEREGRTLCKLEE